MPVEEQIAVLLATTEGLFDAVPSDRMAEAEEAVRAAVQEAAPTVAAAIRDGEPLGDEARAQLLSVARTAVSPLTAPDRDG
jgi:F-type H+-transporting ATPase subunit alpha